jgi:hypothetical protein
MELEPQVKMGYTFSKRDINWWMEQGAEARKQIKPSPDDVSVGKFVTNLKNYVQGTRIKRWWSRSNTFDPIFLHRNFQDFLSREQLDEILPFWLVRDIRTYIDTRFDFNPNMKNGFCPIDDENLWNQYFVPHNSIHDVAADVLRLQRIERTIHLD